jgi:hypothetical protein
MIYVEGEHEVRYNPDVNINYDTIDEIAKLVFNKVLDVVMEEGNKTEQVYVDIQGVKPIEMDILSVELAYQGFSHRYTHDGDLVIEIKNL